MGWHVMKINQLFNQNHDTFFTNHDETILGATFTLLDDIKIHLDKYFYFMSIYIYVFNWKQKLWNSQRWPWPYTQRR